MRPLPRDIVERNRSANEDERNRLADIVDEHDDTPTAFPAEEATGVHDSPQEKISKRVGRANTKLDAIAREQHQQSRRYEAISGDLHDVMVEAARLSVKVDSLIEAQEKREEEARLARAAAADHRSKRTLALIAIVGPIVSALIAATAVLIAKG